MDEVRTGGAVPAARPEGKRWAPAAASEVVRRVAAGESLRGVCKDPAMPPLGTVRHWVAKREGFRAEVEAARATPGRSLTAPLTGYCRETAEAIFERLCAGESMVAICGDPTMPVVSTVYKWMKEQDDFRRAVTLAREIQGDALGALGWEIAQAAKAPEAQLTDVRLRHLRWWAAKLSPKVYGPARAVEFWRAQGEAEAPAPPQVTRVSRKSFWVETGPEGQTRVRASWYDSLRGQIVEDVPGDWELSPGHKAWEAQRAAEDRARQARLAGPRAPDPEGWL